MEDKFKIRLKGTTIESTAWPDIHTPYYWYYDTDGTLKKEHRNKVFEFWERVENIEETKEK
jgi:hypothetical protein